MDKQQYVKARHTDRGLEIHIDRNLAGNFDSETIANCARELLSCADKNACLNERFALTATCFETFAKHNSDTKCLQTGFGVSRKDTDRGLEIHIDHPLARRLDAEIVAGCFGELLSCANENACFKERFALTATCFETFVKHNSDTKCLETGFGVSRQGSEQY